MIILVMVVLAFVPAFFFAWFIYWLDWYEKEPKILLGIVFFWGAVVAVIGALLMNIFFDNALQVLLNNDTYRDFARSAITAPIVEEFWKGLAVFLVFMIFRREFDSILDGMIYGGVTALGFAATENVLFFYQSYSQGGWTDVFNTFFYRIILFPWEHPSATALTGIGFGISRTNRNTLIKFTAPVAGLFLAMAGHSLLNIIASLADMTGAAGVFGAVFAIWVGWFIMLGFVVWNIRREQDLLKKHLSEEVSNGLLSQAQYQTAISFFRFGAYSSGIRSGALGATLHLYQLCGKLAHKKEQLENNEDESGNRALIESLRADIRRSVAQAKA